MAEVTNYIDRLVAELCPDGVEYRPLGEIVKIKNGKGYKDFLPGNIPVYGSGGVMTYVDTFAYDKPTVLIPRKGSLGNLFYLEEPFWNVDTIFYTEIDESCVIPKYLFYVLKSAELEKLNTAGGVPSLTQKVLNKVLIPVPPLEIQEAIVEILDKFTNLEAELEAELEARTLQYEYYRDSLFEALDCPRVPLGSFTQYSKDRKKDDSTVSVYVGVENLKSDFQGCAPTESTNPGVVFQKGDILLGNIRPYLKKMWRADSDGVASPDVLVIRIRDEFSEKISSRYLYHLLASNEFVGYNVAHSRGGKMPRGNKAKILEFEVPVPSLEEQQRIVDILDRFDALTGSLSEGLPAELAARRSQYEYYRDQLLTFPRKGENQ